MLRRVILVVSGTAAAVASALAYNPPQLTQVSTSSKPATSTPSTSTPATPSTPTSGKATPAPKSTPTTPATKLPSGDFSGNKIQTRWGPVQVQITVKDGVITAANALAFPDGDRRSLSISQQAIPYLIEQSLGVVSSSQVMGVSQATYTSNGWRASLQSAIKKAGI
ncbi:unannotated protein [freshwater metagenome]|uniref:Unannotated protein n=1 Tax=freshwater metagenome TaxID=449393 RepID=A0A6J6KRQ6_9ZZZZ|nr:FMN-binding protein [Actinomycetota bacterium]